MTADLTRREAVLLVAAAGSADDTAAQTLSSAPPPSPAWCDRPMRWAQVAFTEDDPGQYDPKMWLDYFREIHADAACLSAGGVVAFYPTAIPLHYRSRFLGSGDAFGDLVKGCRSLGMNVIARTDPHAMREEAFRAHPEWVARDATGAPRRHWADPSLYVTCALGPYNFEFMTGVTREIVSRYRVDGVFSNRWAGHGICYCESCRKLFRAFSGIDLPTGPDHSGPAWRKHAAWEESRLFELWRLWDRTIRAVNPEACFIANSGGGALSELDMSTVGQLAPILFADKQARRGLMPPWGNGKNGKEYRSAMGRKPIGGIFSVGVEEPYRWKDSVQSAAEIKVWAIDGIAQGLRPWFTKFNAKPYDKRWMPVVKDIYTWHWKNESYLRNEANLARAAIVYSQQTARFYGGEQARRLVEEPLLGCYQALVEARIPFEMVHDRMLDAERLKPYQLLVLPNLTLLSDAQCRQIEAFVANGGSLVATSETSLHDEQGNPRPDFGLARLFGCSYAGRIDQRLQNSYLTLEHATNHPILAGFAGTPRIINGVRWVHTKSAGYRAPVTLVPSYPDLPMESVWTGRPRTDQPAVYCREAGPGRVVYFPMDIDRTFWEVLSGDHAQLLRNAFLWACPKVSPVRVTGQGFLDLAVWRQKDSLTLHIVNLTNPMSMKGPFREFYPVGPLRIEWDLPEGVNPKNVRFLVSAARPAWKRSGNTLNLDVPRVELHEVIALDLKG
ncbi:MAG: beta-galactosidase trimerization domain-containing protein [Bryobacterales bacterium]|nr:beta-galactosidase trimerization domain-containing protein [Bryobacterales bacterium]